MKSKDTRDTAMLLLSLLAALIVMRISLKLLHRKLIGWQRAAVGYGTHLVVEETLPSVATQSSVPAGVWCLLLWLQQNGFCTRTAECQKLNDVPLSLQKIKSFGQTRKRDSSLG